MTKKVLSAVCASMFLFSGMASAQVKSSAAETKDLCRSKTEQCQSRTLEAVHSDAKDVCRAGSCEFEGLNLTDAQKQQLKELKQKNAADAKLRRDSLKSERKADKQKMKEDRKAMRQQVMADRRQYLDDIKKIVGDENYVIYLENQFVEQAGRGDKGSQYFGPKGGDKGMKFNKDGRFEKGPKFDKSQKGDNPKAKADKKDGKKGGKKAGKKA